MPPEHASQTATAEPEFWQSVDQWMDTPQFREMLQNEFPEDAAEWVDPVSRRKFLSLMGASVALAGAVGCNPSIRPASRRQVVPYVNQPDQILPGVPLFFATAMAQANGVGLGLIVKSVDGRPIKCEGNPNHPSSLGSVDLQALAAPLSFYDPDRSQAARMGETATTTDKAIAAFKEILNRQSEKPLDQRGEGVRLLTEPTTSPTLIRLMEELLKRFPAAKWVQYEAVGNSNSRKGLLAAFGKHLTPVYNFAAADVVLSLDADFLSGPGSVRYARDFGSRRKISTVDAAHELEEKNHKAHPKDNSHYHPAWEEVIAEATEGLNRLYVVEGGLTSTGAIADHRLPLKPSQVELFARALAVELKVDGVTVGTGLPEAAFAWIKPLAADLSAHKTHAVVIAGEHQSPAVHILVAAINNKLDADHAPLKYTKPLDALEVVQRMLDANRGGDVAKGWPTADAADDFKKLVGEMRDGKVHTLVMSGVNPVFDAPADLDFANALNVVKAKKNGGVFHHGLYVDESAVPYATWHINGTHFLEAWGDVRGHDGTAALQQPLIAPLYRGKSLLEIVAAALEYPITDGQALVKDTWEKFHTDKKISGETPTFAQYWERTVRDGVLAQSKSDFPYYPAAALGAVKLDKLAAVGFTQAAIEKLEIQFRPDPSLYDGRQANNGWLQELPKPVTNLTWDNAAMISPRTADELKFTQNFSWTGGERGSTETDIAEITVAGRTLKVAVHVQPGMADNVVVLHLGFGRERAGKVGDGRGFNTYKLRGTDAVWNAAVPEMRRTGDRYTLAVAGAHAAMESRRPVRHASIEQYKDDEAFAQIPATSASEFEEIRMLTPGTIENFELNGLKHPHAHDHGDRADHEHKTHDARLKKLSLYLVNPITVNGEEATKSYRRWGMAIDLGSCIGCSACTLACVAENNIPVVGKDQVMRGRAMHWIRIDRYFSIPGVKTMGDELGAAKIGPAARKEKIKESAAIRTHFQPVPCQQCEKAPCEVVCPVGATVHGADGLNDMVYNRCVGTRYCSNNCPYKVRRFNFLQYTDYTTDSLKLLNNPEVTVRTRGVMEKCTYCVQRIRNAEIEAEREWDKKKPDGTLARERDTHGRPKIMDGEILTACQQACPTAAITFGDLNDPKSDVIKLKAEPHNYGLLAELNTMPRTSYLAAIRNPNKNMPQGA